MKKISKISSLLMSLVIFAVATVNAQNTFSISNIGLEPDTQSTLEITLDNQDQYYGFSFDVTLPSGLEFVTDAQGKADVSLVSSRLSSSYRVVTNLVNGKLLLGSFSAAMDDPIKGTSGAILQIKVNVSHDFKQSSMRLSNVKLIDASDRDVPLRDISIPIGVLPVAVALEPTEITLAKDETIKLEASLTTENTTLRTLTWTSSDESVATVSNDGVVNAVYKGNAVITATTINGKTASTDVTVLIPAVGLSLEPSELIMEKGTTETLVATPDPIDTSDEITWMSSDESVVTVNDGVLEAISGGNAVITARCGEIESTCNVTVIVTPTAMTLTNYELLIQVEKNAELGAIIEPADATDKSVIWSSDNESIATVDELGNVYAITPGVAIVTATSVANPLVKAICRVTVVPEIVVVANIFLDPTQLEMYDDETFKLTATIVPDDATDTSVTWMSSDVTVAEVSDEGVVTAKAAGTAIIYASSSNGLTVDCDVTVKARVVDPTGISLSNTELLMREGYTADLIAIVAPDDATDKSVVWSSSDEEIATVDQNGVVTAIKQGNATITATTVNGLQAQCSVTVVPVVIAVEDITLNRTSLELTVDDSFTLTATITPDDATDKTVTWKSLDKSVATVSENGEVLAIGVGTTIIYASSSNGLTAECIVTVNPGVIEVASISLSNTELIMKEGDVTDLIAIVRPSDATDQSVTWSSLDETVATVDDKGVVTAIKQGHTTVVVTAANGIKAECSVTVIPLVIAVEGITLNKTELTIKESDSFTLIATITPDEASDKTVTWRSSDTSVATVSENGEVTGVRAGTATVYASSSNGLTAECAVTVTPGEIAVLSISLSNTELLMRKGYSTELIAIVRPDDATDKSVVWSSSDETIATVDQNGIVSAKNVGNVIIRATSGAYPTVYAECNVTVEDETVIVAVESITINKTELTLKEGESFTLVATIAPDDATDKSVTWKSSDRTVATVAENGEVTGVRAGTATIYASSSNGLTVECAVTVIPGEIAVTGISLSNTELLMTEGDTAELLAIVRPADATDQSVMWRSEDETIATVDQNGIVTAVKQGVTTVSAASANGVQANCVVTVVPLVIDVTGISLNKTTLELINGDSFTLIATITPDDASDKTVTWRSSDRGVATVSENGEVLAVGVGTATVYASSSNGLTAECLVTVIPGVIPVESISLSNTELLMREGHTADLIAIIRPSDATDQTVKWTTDNEEIATVDDKGIVTAIKQGFAIITATSVNGMTAICAVTVVPDIVAVEDLTVTPTQLTLTEGDIFTLTATVTPADATDKTVTWLSSNEAVATVSADGEVLAVKAGSAEIFASSSNGLTAICNVTVEPLYIDVTSIALDPTEMTLWVGESAVINALILPEDATDKTVTWTSNYPVVAEVDNGVVTGLTPGIATIMAKSSNGKSVFCAVTVMQRPMTPRQLLRKGDGTTSTFVVMMDLTDAELTELGYHYVFGYTDNNGHSTIIAETPLRYCHTTPQVFNNPSFDFWVFSVLENEEGEAFTSNLRHLDGTEEICFDTTIYGFDPKGHKRAIAEGDNWITVTPTHLSISIDGVDETMVAVYTTAGAMVYSKSYPTNAPLTHEVKLSRFAPGSYVVTMTRSGETKAKKILVR